MGLDLVKEYIMTILILFSKSSIGLVGIGYAGVVRGTPYMVLVRADLPDESISRLP